MAIKEILYPIASILLLLALCMRWPLSCKAAVRLQRTDSPIVVVIDPGHGGDNNGTTENGYLEKEMNMTTAMALYDELSQFEGIEVYLTHTEDKDLSLKERAKFAAEKHADFLISIHYNASESHELFGSEVWISLFPDIHYYGYQLGREVLSEMQEMGLHIRGIKTRPHSKGKDYYGIIREAYELGIPAMIIEHCHVDHEKDTCFCDTKEKQKEFGIRDAHAIARYYGLKSQSLGIDYTGYSELAEEVYSGMTSGKTIKRAMYDETEPEECSIAIKEISYEQNEVTILLRAKDAESNVIDYGYSLDGGAQYSERIALPDVDILTGMVPEEFEITLKVPDGIEADLCVKVFNPYDLWKESNHLRFEEFSGKRAESQSMEEPTEFEDATASVVSPAEETEMEGTLQKMLSVLKIALPIVGCLFVICLLGYGLFHKKKR